MDDFRFRSWMSPGIVDSSECSVFSCSETTALAVPTRWMFRLLQGTLPPESVKCFFLKRGVEFWVLQVI